MLGNFSFGDYFKSDAIAWSWEFLTKNLQLPAKRLWVSVYHDDEEAYEIWKKLVPESRIKRMGEETNFWTMGPTGPCGPCSEIYWDNSITSGETDAGPDESNRWMEIWNLVFTQFDRQPDGSLLPLPKKNIDTGMGLERLTSVAESVSNNFDTSLLKPLIRFGEETLKHKYGSDPRKDIGLRIVADHLRAVTFLIHDGVLPSNEGRGYVLRRLLRRAVRQGSLFGKREPFLHKGVHLVADLMKETADDLPSRRENIKEMVKQEEERFMETIDAGTEKLNFLIAKLKDHVTAEDFNAIGTGKTKTFSEGDTLTRLKITKAGKALTMIPGEIVFGLYETYGFPPELTREILAEQDIAFEEEEFNHAKEAAQETARKGWKGSGAEDVTGYNALQKKIGSTEFRGYDTLSIAGVILAIAKEGRPVDTLTAGESGEIMASETPFYPEGGGQVGDKGWLRSLETETVLADVTDTQKPVPDFIVHKVTAATDLKTGDKVEFLVDKNHRDPTRRHHTATHLLHAALRKVLGTTVTQAGSLVAPDRLRFDYTHNKPPTPEQLQEIENIVNDIVLQNLKVTPKVFPAEVAKQMGAMALFGEKYGDDVRCLLVSNKGYEDSGDAFSLELCGGTHVSATGDIGLVKIVSDTSLAAGVRRLEAIAGRRSLEFLRRLEIVVDGLAEKLKSPPEEVESRIAKLLEKNKQLEQENREFKLKQAQGGGSQTQESTEPQVVNGLPVLVKVVDDLSTDDLRTLADRLKQQLKSGVVFVASVNKEGIREKIAFVIAATSDMRERWVNAGAIAKKIAAELTGSGGGREDFAQGGGLGKDKLDVVLKNLPNYFG